MFGNRNLQLATPQQPRISPIKITTTKQEQARRAGCTTMSFKPANIVSSLARTRAQALAGPEKKNQET